MDTSKYMHTKDVHNLKSPDIVVPLLIELLKPASILDVGCGIGTWLNSFYRNGVTDIVGIDGDFVDRELLKQFISIDAFKPVDLVDAFDLKRKFDLVICLEVAEHLPETSSNNLVSSLCQHSDVIIFSAAVPGQGGQNHINEQWLDYWIKKFSEHGFKAFDLIRPVIWNMADVDWWYKQNMIVLSKADLTVNNTAGAVLNYIHPDLFRQNLDYIIYLQEYVRQLESK